jgi:hypothetical protein
MAYGGAGIKSIAFADIWTNAASARRAREYFRSVPAGTPIDFSRLNESDRYVLQTAQPFSWIDASGVTQTTMVPIFGAHSITVDGVTVSLISSSSWSQTAPGRFETRVVDETNREILRVSRHFLLGDTFDITVETRVRNLAGRAMNVSWSQYGPIELNEDHGLIDRRRFGFGYRPDPKRLPDLVLTDSSDMVMERGDLLKRLAKGLAANATPQDRAEYLTIWPNKHTRGTPWELSWFTTCNRYFAMAVHPVLNDAGQGNRALTELVQDIRIQVSPADILPGDKINPHAVVLSFFESPAHTLEPGEEWPLDMGIYAGPLDRHILGEPPYSLLAMDGMILYQMSSMCAFCTFQWLAHGLLWFLSTVHAVTFDWGISIIILVLLVRLLLHPITKKSQRRLRPIPEGLTLKEGLTQLNVLTADAHGVDCSIDYEPSDLNLSEVASLHYFRIAEEAISNSIKHGKAKRIEIGCRVADGEFELKVVDDGSGIEDQANDNGLGLRIMKHRASAMGGTIRLEAVPAGGTMLICRCRLHLLTD